MKYNPRIEDKDVWTLEESAGYLGMGLERTRKIIVSSGISPVRTHAGSGYQSDDIRSISKTRPNRADHA